MKADQSIGGDQFVLLGTYNFDQGDAAVILRDLTGDTGKRLYFDAVKWEPVDGSPTITPLPNVAGTYDDTNRNISYSGSWILEYTDGPYSDSRHFSYAAGSSASLTFYGSQMSLFYSGDADRGQLEIRIDGDLVAALNQYAPQISWQKRWDGPVLSNGPHTVTLKHISGSFVDIDAIIISDPSGIPSITPTPTNTLPPVGEVRNLAIGKPASQSSTFSHPYSGAKGAVDGVTNGEFFAASTTHTNYENRPWWQVDLGKVENIQRIKVWNRTDCCWDRLRDFYVLVSDVPFISTDLDTTLLQPGVSGYHISAEAGRPTEVAVNRTGRYVRVQLVGSNYLSISEVEVWGGKYSSTDSCADKDTDCDGNAGHDEYINTYIHVDRYAYSDTHE
ncbi:MAG: discoidin domain-containing protein [Anaerolineaceae bacterium]|nr:discoidin domain-containing protein [Anaerolineaceae bacterium]